MGSQLRNTLSGSKWFAIAVLSIGPLVAWVLHGLTSGLGYVWQPMFHEVSATVAQIFGGLIGIAAFAAVARRRNAPEVMRHRIVFAGIVLAATVLALGTVSFIHFGAWQVELRRIVVTTTTLSLGTILTGYFLAYFWNRMEPIENTRARPLGRTLESDGVGSALNRNDDGVERVSVVVD